MHTVSPTPHENPAPLLASDPADDWLPWTPIVTLLQANNPVLLAEIGLSGVARTVEELAQQTWHTVRWLLLLLIVPGLVSAIYTIETHQYFREIPATRLFPNYALLMEVLSQWFIGLLLLSLIGEVLLDIACAFAAFEKLTPKTEDGLRDLTEFTPAPQETLLEALLVAHLLRTWRYVVGIVTLRVMSLIVLAVYLLMPNPFADGWIYGLSLGRQEDGVVLVLAGIVGLAVAIPVYLVEPFWRHRAVMVTMLAVTSENDPNSSFLSGLGAVLAIVTSQLFIAGMLYVSGFVAIFALTFGVILRGEGLEFLLIGAVLLLTLLTAAVIHLYYQTLARWMIRHLNRRLFGDTRAA